MWGGGLLSCIIHVLCNIQHFYLKKNISGGGGGELSKINLLFMFSSGFMLFLVRGVTNKRNLISCFQVLCYFPAFL